VQGFTSIVGALKNSSDVVYRNGLYSLAAHDVARFLNVAFPAPGGSSSQLKPTNIKVEARIQGDYVSWEHVAFSENGSSAAAGTGSENFSEGVDVIARFTQVGSAPAVKRPAGVPTSTG
jgi:hypothetical protein